MRVRGSNFSGPTKQGESVAKHQYLEHGPIDLSIYPPSQSRRQERPWLRGFHTVRVCARQYGPLCHLPSCRAQPISQAFPGGLISLSWRASQAPHRPGPVPIDALYATSSPLNLICSIGGAALFVAPPKAASLIWQARMHRSTPGLPATNPLSAVEGRRKRNGKHPSPSCLCASTPDRALPRPDARPRGITRGVTMRLANSRYRSPLIRSPLGSIQSRH